MRHHNNIPRDPHTETQPRTDGETSDAVHASQRGRKLGERTMDIVGGMLDILERKVATKQQKQAVELAHYMEEEDRRNRAKLERRIEEEDQRSRAKLERRRDMYRDDTLADLTEGIHLDEVLERGVASSHDDYDDPDFREARAQRAARQYVATEKIIGFMNRDNENTSEAELARQTKAAYHSRFIRQIGVSGYNGPRPYRYHDSGNVGDPIIPEEKSLRDFAAAARELTAAELQDSGRSVEDFIQSLRDKEASLVAKKL